MQDTAHSATALPFRTLRDHLRETHGESLYRVALDAGSDCPNRDGTKGRGGCVYCDVEGSGTGALRRGVELEDQLLRGLKRIARRRKPGRAIAYLQSYSNTYVSTERLEQVLGVLAPHLGGPVAALSIATRPDTLADEALDVLERCARRVPVWVELGLECADDARLVEINRLHTVADFERAAERARARGLLVVAHAILGLPGDGREGARRTAEVIARSAASGVKVHQLMVLQRTQLAHWWRAGRVQPLEPQTYVEWLADFVERLRTDQVLHRLMGDAPDGTELAPRWTVHRNWVREALARELWRRGTRQGDTTESHSPSCDSVST